MTKEYLARDRAVARLPAARAKKQLVVRLRTRGQRAREHTRCNLLRSDQSVRRIIEWALRMLGKWHDQCIGQSDPRKPQRQHAVALLLTRWIRIIEALPPPPPPSRLCSGKLLLLFLLLLLMMIPKCQSHFLSRRRQKILPPIKDPPCHREVYLPIAVAVSCR